MKDYWQDASHQHFVYRWSSLLPTAGVRHALPSGVKIVETCGVCRWYNIPLTIGTPRHDLMGPKCTTYPQALAAQLCDVFYMAAEGSARAVRRSRSL